MVTRAAYDNMTRRRAEQVQRGWIGFDLDGTLGFYDEWRGWNDIGSPIMPMVYRVRRLLGEGHDVRRAEHRAHGVRRVRGRGIGPEGQAVSDNLILQSSTPLPLTFRVVDGELRMDVIDMPMLMPILVRQGERLSIETDGTFVQVRRVMP
jgi:hypothetical protein